MKTELTKGNILKSILWFALPIYIGQLFSMLYGIIDTRIVGSVLGGSALASVSVTSSLSELIIEFENGISCGFGIILAQLAGAENRERIRKTIAHSLVLITGIAALISVMCILFIDPILHFLNVEAGIEAEAREYIVIALVGMIFLAIYNLMAAILRSQSDSVTPLVILIASNVLNIVLDILFVKQLGWGVRGAALATAATQMAGCLVCGIYLFIRRKELRPHLSDFIPEGKLVASLMKNGMSMGVMLSFVLLGSLVLQTAINTLGPDIIVAHTAARRITMLCLIPFFSIGAAMSTFCGQNKGANQPERIRKGVNISLMVSAIWWVFSVTVMNLVAAGAVSLITASFSQEIISNAVRYLRINSVLFFLPALICILRNSLQGLGNTRIPLVSSFIELVGKVLITYTLIKPLGYMGVIVSEPIVWTLMVIPLVVVWFKKVSVQEEKI